MCDVQCVMYSVMWCNVHLSAGAVSTPSLCPGDTCNSSICCTAAMHCYALAPQQPSTGTFFSIILIFRNIPASLNTFNRSSECRDSSVAFFILIVCAAWAPPWPSSVYNTMYICSVLCSLQAWAPPPRHRNQLRNFPAVVLVLALSPCHITH